MKGVQAFAPGNISCFFKSYDHKNPRWRGSCGLGFTVDKGVIVRVEKKEARDIVFNEKPIDFPTVSYVITQLTEIPVSVSITSSLPLGSGFGLSGASALATAYALNKLLHLRKTNKQLAIIAHTADALHKTGLGDVVNQYFGGFLLKTEPSSQFSVTKMDMTGIPVYWSSYGSFLTNEVLSDKSLLVSIDKAASVAMYKTEELLRVKKATLGDVLDISYDFVVSSGLLRDTSVRTLVEMIRENGGHASMILLGNSLMSDKPFKGAKKLMISDTAANVL